MRAYKRGSEHSVLLNLKLRLFMQKNEDKKQTARPSLVYIDSPKGIFQKEVKKWQK